MADNKQVKQELEQARHPQEWLAKTKKALSDGPLGKLSEGLLRRRDENRYYLRPTPAEEKAGETLAALTPRQRADYFAKLLPSFAPYIGLAWDRLAAAPYEASFTTLPFRVPGDPSIHTKSQGEWFVDIAHFLHPYNGDIRWLAVNAPHLVGEYDNTSQFAWILAAAIDKGDEVGDEVFDILRETTLGQRRGSDIGLHIILGLLASSRPEGWQAVGKLLLAAQREEGLRQAILECAHIGHPGAFRYLLRLILDENLIRFAATVRAADVWLGLLWDSAATRIVRTTLERLLPCLESEKARAAALKGKDPETVFLALWATAFEDAHAAFAAARPLLKDKDPERRFVAVHLLAQLHLPPATQLLTESLDDPDLRVAARACEAFTGYGERDPIDHPGAFDGLERLLQRIPKKEVKLEAIVWPWWERTLKADQVSYALLNNIGKRPPLKLAHLLPKFGTYARSNFADEIGKIKPPSEEARAILVGMLADSSGDVREHAFKAIARHPIQEDELALHGKLLSRKNSDLRKNILLRLAKLPAARQLACARDYLTSKDAQVRMAGLELLRALVEAKKELVPARELAQQYAAEHKKIEQVERAHLDIILGKPSASGEATLENALGLLPDDWRPSLPTLTRRNTTLSTPAALATIESLCKLVEQHGETEVEFEWYDGRVEKRLLSDGGIAPPAVNKPVAEILSELPLRDVWLDWLKHRAGRDDDGLELTRALALWCLRADEVDLFRPSSAGPAAARLFKNYPTRHLVKSLLEWMVRIEPGPGSVDYLLDVFEDSLCDITPEVKEKLVERQRQYSRDDNFIQLKLPDVIGRVKCFFESEVQTQQGARKFFLERWRYEQLDRDESLLPSLHDFAHAFKAGEAISDDLIDLLIRRGPDTRDRSWGRRSFDHLKNLTALKRRDPLKDLPQLDPVIERIRDRIIDIELTRGEVPVVTSDAAEDISSAGGLANLSRILEALGKSRLSRTNSNWRTPSRGQSLAHLLSVTHPQPGETPAAFAAHLKPLNIPQSRFLELAVFAPQWAAHVEHTLNWPGLEESVWWLHAHTRPRNEWDKTELHEAWAAQISKRTPILADDLGDGAVDVAWFHACHKALGKDRWTALDQAAKYASSGGGHKRAQLFADALRGEIDRKDLAQRIKKRQPDAVRTLGLVPLPAAAKQREAELLSRYEQLQEFRRESRKFGSMKQATEKRAVEIAMDNLARTAGYADPLRLQWAMEKRAVADLAKGPITVKASETEVSLAIGPDGKPELTIIKKGKALASIPAALKKHEKIQELKSRAGDLKKQASRMRKALEESMCRGDTFTGAELPGLFEHPILAPMLARLVFIGEGIMGYPATDGKARGRLLLAPGGKAEPIKPAEELRIAHPADLFAGSAWHEWQRDCFAAERVQPFKQVFREFYPLTPAERAEGQLGAEGASRSTRYSGHQVVPRQAIALLGQRGWVAAPEEGVSRTFHAERLTVNLGFMEAFYTPAEIDGLTIEDITFTKRGEYKAIPLTEVPPRVFSEVMRDLDLVVSVAHRGGVDPEATESTVETRAALLRETASLLGLSNITFRGSHAVIKGERATYSLHLGSAITHVQPGGALFIVPAHSQHRGRIFLPFADDDPKTAEVLSKALLLARDEEIRDPSILQQIGRAS